MSRHETPKHCDEQELVAGLRAGSEWAFREIDARFRAELQRHAARVCGDRHLAEDVVQDVLLATYRALQRSDAHVDLRAYLHRAARNRALDMRRRRGADDADISTVEAPAATHAEPVVTLIHRETLREAVEDISALASTQRAVLIGRELEGATHLELADRLDTSVAATKALRLRAHRALVARRRARDRSCPDVRAEILSAYERGVRPTADTLRHVDVCGGCRVYRTTLKARVATRVACLFPIGRVHAAARWTTRLADAAAPVKTSLAVAATVTTATAGLVVGTSGTTYAEGAPSPMRIAASGVLAHGLNTGRPLPRDTSLVTRTLGTTGARRVVVSIRCPGAMRVAGVVPNKRQPSNYWLTVGTAVGRSRTANIVVDRSRTLGHRRVLAVLCRRPAVNGSILAVPAVAARVRTHVCVPRARVYLSPGRYLIGILVRGQPIQARGRWRRWAYVLADTGLRGWVRTRAICGG